jgi:predicted  nucleic acid-binding Zn-ribbon protein
MCDDIDDAFSQCTNCGRLFEDDGGIDNEYVTLCDDCWYELHGDDEEVMDDEKGWL